MAFPSRVVASLFLVLFASAAAADCLAPTWEPRVSLIDDYYHLRTTALAVDHFDGDANLDAVTIRRGALDEVMLSRGTGNGYFAAPVSVHSGAELFKVIAKDINGDAKLDLLVHEYGDLRVAYLPGNGDGTFGTPVRSSMQIGGSFGVADLTGDDIVDIVASTYEESGAKLTLYTGTNTGAFTETRRIALGGIPMAIAAGDLDGDQVVDVAVFNSNATLDLFFGNGGGTFDPVLTIGNALTGGLMALADAEGDGDLDILVSSHPNTLSIHRNLGGRLFAAVVAHPIVSPDSISNGAYHVAPGDFTGDGVRDLLVSAINGGYVATLRGKGDGTFHAPSFESVQRSQIMGPVGAVLDFDGDGRLDAITFKYGYRSEITSLRNRCGDIAAYLTGAPVVSVGQTVTYRVSMTPQPPQILTTTRMPVTGTISIREGATVVATGTLTDGAASITATALPIGSHTLVAHYLGDAQYEPTQSPAFAQRVTAETTTTTVSTTPAESVYGQTFQINAAVTASDGTTPVGTADLTLGLHSWEDVNMPATRTVNFLLAVGSFEVTARYGGDSSHPPSDATPFTHVVRKATPGLKAFLTESNQAGSNVTVAVDTTTEFDGTPTGAVQLFDRNGLITTMQMTSGGAAFVLNGLDAGRHDFSLRYAGDSNFNPAESTVVTHQVFPPSGLHIDARGNSATIGLVWTKPNPGTNDWTWGVVRSVAPSQSFGNYAFGPNSPAIDASAATATVYLYRLQVRDWGTNQLLATSPIDLGVRMSFSEDPLLPGMLIRASHLQELIAATNFLRGKAGQSPVTFADAAAGNRIRASHITTLRTRINEARVALGAAAVTFSRTIAAGDTIRAQDVQELREAVH